VQCGEDEEPRYKINFIDSLGGSINQSSGLYELGTYLKIEAIPDENYSFVNWTGTIESKENPLGFSVSREMNLQANFRFSGDAVYLDDNGITIKAKEGALIGDSAK
jgi:hypothetical protein